jgi:hypothetical protein
LPSRLYPPRATTERAREIGDFNGDDKSDVLWQNGNGGVAMWQMNANQFTGMGVTSMPNGWHIVG